MKRAVEVFEFERPSSCSPFVAGMWQTRSESAASFLSVAVTHWEMVVTRREGTAWMTVRGPETRATTAPIPEDAAFFGIQLRLGTYMPRLDLRELVDRSVTLPQVTKTLFWFGGAAWELPGPANADVFVDRLVRAGLLVHDPVVSGALQGHVTPLSARSVERRVRRATGLTHGTIRQILRAERTVELLVRGVPAADVARQAGYADQPHLIRSLKRFVGQTPSQIATLPPGT